MAKKAIYVQLGIQQLEDEKLITEKLADEIKAYSDHIGIDINFDYGALPDPLWKEETNAFTVLKDIPNIVDIRELFVPKDLRRNGYGTTIISIITTILGKNSLVFAEASISTKEYPPMKYSLKENDEGKEVIDVEKVLDENTRFFATSAFINVDPIMDHENDMSRMLVHQNLLGRIAFEYMRAFVVTKETIAAIPIRDVYREVFYLLLKFNEDDDAYAMPITLEEKICPDLNTDMSEEDLQKAEWYSDFKGEKGLVADVALKNRLVLSDVGGQEVRIGSKNVSAMIGPFSVYLEKNDNYKNVDPAENDDFDIVAKYKEDDSPVMFMVGYCLLGDGIWYECDFYYDTDTYTLYPIDYNANDVLAAVFNFSHIHAVE